MTGLTLYSIRDSALNSGRAVFSVQQLSNLISKSRAISTVYLSRLVKKGLAVKLMKGRISFIEDDFVIATQLVEPSYISLDSSLLFHEVITQIPREIDCITTKNSINHRKLGIRYHKMPGSLFFGYRRISKGKSYFLVAEPEKAIIDGLYLNIYSKKDLIEYRNALDLDKMLKIVGNLRFNGAKKMRMVIKSLTKSNY